jgi:YegS/Rv2252/BmrU family lipid kinase
MNIVAIVNGKAGRANPFRLPLPAEVLETQGPGHAIELTRQVIKRGARTIIAVGGDGTINEVVNGFFENEKMISTDVELSIVPRGTGSDFVRVLNRAVPRGDRRMIDLMKVGYTTSDGRSEVRYSVNITSFGMGGEVADRVNRSTKLLGGRIAFLTAMVQTAWSFQGNSVTLQFDNSKTLQARIIHVAVGNGQYHGAGMWVCPGAMIDDGLLDVTVVRYLTLPELLKSLPTLYSGAIYSHPKVESHRVKHMKAESKERVVVEIDGEPSGYLPIEISVLPKAIRVWVP